MRPEDEDEITFVENGNEGHRLRVLRGTITGEDEVFLTIARRDGEWRIRKALIEKIRRAPRRGVRP